MVTGSFGTKKFEVSANKIYTPNGLSLSEEIELEETAVSGAKPTVKVKGVKLKTVSFELKLDGRFVNITTEISFWESTMKAKKPKELKLGIHKLGWYYITKYSITSYTIRKDGAYRSATISLSFTEDPKNGVTTTTSSTKTTTATTQKATTVKKSVAATSPTIGIGAIARPKSGKRWYYTAEGAYTKSSRVLNGKATVADFKVTHIYKKNSKIVCINLAGKGWMRVEEVTVIKGVSKNGSIQAVAIN